MSLRDITEIERAEDFEEKLADPVAQCRELRTTQAQPEPECAIVGSILNNIDGVVWSVDLRTRATLYVNPAIESLFGYSAEAYLNDASLWRSLVYPSDRPKIEQVLGQLRSQERFEVEYRIIRADGEIRWVRDRARVVCDADGTPIRLDLVTADITDQKQMEEALRLSESRLRAIFQQAAIGINQAAPDGRFLQVNQAYCGMLGYTEAELLQMRYQDVAHPEECEETEAVLAKLYAGEASSVTLEKRYFHKDGSVRWTNIVLSILRDDNGQEVSDIAIVQDISERKRGEAERKRIEQALEEERSLFIDGPTVIIRWSTTSDWLVEYVSPNIEAQLGYDPKALVEDKVSFPTLMHPDDVERIQAETSSSIAAQAPYLAQQYRLRHANGQYRWIDEFTRVIYGPDGAVTQFLGYIQDVTERKETELALRQNQATKQAMLAAVPDLLMRVSQHGVRYEFISGGEITLYGDANPHVPQSLHDMLPKALADQRIFFIRRALDTGERQIYEYPIEIDGRLCYEEARIVPMNQDEALVMVRNITNRVGAEQALRESQQRFEAIFNQMYQFIGLLAPDGTVLETNQTALAFGGFEREAVVGHPFWEAGWGQISSDTQTQLKQAIAAAAQGKFVRYEVIMQGANQRVITIDFSLRPVLGEQGQVVLLIPEGRDITERKKMEEELRHTKSVLEQTNTLARVGGWEVDLLQGTVHWARITREIHEVDADFEPSLTKAIDFYHEGTHRQRITAVVDRALQTGQPWDEKLKIVTAKGRVRWVRALGQAEFRAGSCARLYGAFQDIDTQMQAEIQLKELTQKLRHANEELNRMATTDALTQLANRRHFDQLLRIEWARAIRNGTSLSLIICDVDYFKPYNDHYGHPAGDRCLQQVAQLLQAHIQRPGDLLARYGGEEFVILLPKTTRRGAIAVAARIQESFNQARLPHAFSPVADYVTLSFGVACCRPFSQNLFSELLAAADDALYQAKSAGRNRYSISSSD
ncbi:MAG: PAS domain S-box protein [Nodosilinea sp.]